MKNILLYLSTIITNIIGFICNILALDLWKASPYKFDQAGEAYNSNAPINSAFFYKYPKNIERSQKFNILKVSRF